MYSTNHMSHDSAVKPVKFPCTLQQHNWRLQRLSVSFSSESPCSPLSTTVADHQSPCCTFDLQLAVAPAAQTSRIPVGVYSVRQRQASSRCLVGILPSWALVVCFLLVVSVLQTRPKVLVISQQTLSKFPEALAVTSCGCCVPQWGGRCAAGCVCGAGPFSIYHPACKAMLVDINLV